MLVISLKTFSQAPVWVNSQGGTGDNSDKYYVVKADAAGNIYCAGYTFEYNTDWNYLLVKLNSAGDTLWTRTYNGAGNGPDKILFMDIDGSDNVYVCGSTDGIGTGSDITTIKYASDGSILWTATYNYAPFNEDEYPGGIEVNSTGDVYITGYSDRDSSSVTNNDIITIKYNTSGVQQWINRYNGVGSGTDESYGIILDNTERPVVIGRTNVSGTNDNIITIVYNTAGTIVWTASFDRGVAGDDIGIALASDISGNIYSTGYCDNGTDNDIALLKYNSSGIQQFAKFYNNGNNDYPDAIGISGTGNIMIAGHTDVLPGAGGNYDYVVLKYNSSGTLLWNTIYGDPNNKDEDPSDIVVDAVNNIWVTGKSDSSLDTKTRYNFLTLKINSAGTIVWVNEHFGTAPGGDDSGEGMIIKNGSLYVAGVAQNNTSQLDATLVSYDPTTGAKNWVKSFNGTGDFTDKSNAIFIDKANNIFSCGYTRAPEQGKNVFVKKVNSAGTTLWFKTFDFNFEDDEANAMTADTSGNIYICGYSNGKGTSNDYFTMKINNAGDSLWTRFYDFIGESDIAVSIGINSTFSSIYVTGYSDASVTSGKNYDITTIKYNSSGLQQAIVRYNAPANNADKPNKLIINSNSIYLTGTTFNGVNNDLILIKYNASLVQQYLSIYTQNATSDESGNYLAVDAGNAYVTGKTFTALNNNDYVTLKYNSTGVLQWSTLYNSGDGMNDIASSLAFNSAGIYVTGRSAKSLSDSADIVTMKYDKITGAQLWLNRFSNLLNSDDRGSAITIDKFNNPCVAGRCTNATGDFDMICLMYDGAGNSDYIPIYNGAGSKNDFGNAVAFSSEGYLYTGGYITNELLNFDIALLKFCPPAIASAGPDASICKGSSVTLGGSGGGTYSWSPATGLNNVSIANPVAKPSVTTTYIVTVDNGLGCGSPATDTVTVTVNPVPSATITAGGPLTFCIGSSVTLTANAGVGYTYQWFNGATAIAGATSISYVATTSGSYKVQVFNAYGCSKKSSAKTVSAIICDQNEFNNAQNNYLEIAPNPFSNEITIKVNTNFDFYSYKIFSMTGELVESENEISSNQESRAGKNLIPGVYMVEIVSGNTILTGKIIKSN